MQRLADRVAVVTGAAGGIGRAVAEALAREGAVVVRADADGDGLRRIQTAQEAVKDARQPKSMAVPADVTDEESVAGLVQRCLSEFGKIDILVNGAALRLPAPVEDTTEEIWDRVMRVNLVGAFLCAKAVVPGMLERRRGKIINLSSAAAFKGARNNSHYAAAAAGVIGFSKSLALELAPYRITVNTICPDAYDERGEIFPEAFAGPAIFLASDAASYVTGQTLFVNGGAAMGDDGLPGQS